MGSRLSCFPRSRRYSSKVTLHPCYCYFLSDLLYRCCSDCFSYGLYHMNIHPSPTRSSTKHYLAVALLLSIHHLKAPSTHGESMLVRPCFAKITFPTLES